MPSNICTVHVHVPKLTGNNAPAHLPPNIRTVHVHVPEQNGNNAPAPLALNIHTYIYLNRLGTWHLQLRLKKCSLYMNMYLK